MKSQIEKALKTINGPYKMQGGGYNLNLVFKDGTETSRSYPSEQSAKMAMTRMLKHRGLHAMHVSEERKLNVPEYDGTLTWWLEIMAKLAVEVVGGLDKDVRNDLKAISSAALAAEKLYDTSTAEARVEELEKRFAEMSRARSHGIGLSKAS